MLGDRETGMPDADGVGRDPSGKCDANTGIRDCVEPLQFGNDRAERFAGFADGQAHPFGRVEEAIEMVIGKDGDAADGL